MGFVLGFVDRMKLVNFVELPRHLIGRTNYYHFTSKVYYLEWRQCRIDQNLFMCLIQFRRDLTFYNTSQVHSGSIHVGDNLKVIQYNTPHSPFLANDEKKTIS